jgi:hypothetical protein
MIFQDSKKQLNCPDCQLSNKLYILLQGVDFASVNTVKNDLLCKNALFCSKTQSIKVAT